MTLDKPTLIHQHRVQSASWQDSLPSSYRLPVQIICLSAFMLAFIGWLNESWLYWFESPIWLNRYTEYAIILGFGIWRIQAEQNPYTRKRLMVLVGVVTGFWWLIPWLIPFVEYHVGYLWNPPIFPAIHTPGTLTFFLVLGLVYLFGRRVVCGWGCPCVGIRETVGFSFRNKTLRGKWAWRLRHTKWFFFTGYMMVLALTLFSPNAWSVSFVGLFYLVIAMIYFGSFFITPITGNRFYCRYICPFGATFGLLNHAGYYDIMMDKDKCIECKRCEQVCDMGIPVQHQGKAFGQITGIEDCMGCARCVISCPTNALEIRDIRNQFRPSLRQDASYLLKQDTTTESPRGIIAKRPDANQDWYEADLMPDINWIKQQASRCLDCGEPGCRNACPLQNRIPDWLKAAATGDIISAAAITHETNPFPEICGQLCPQHALCEGHCTRSKLEGAVNIGKIEHAVNKIASESGWCFPIKTARPNPYKIAVIGAGPSGLACAQRLIQHGIGVTVYDRNHQIGGLLATGIPSFKLNKEVLNHRQTLYEEAGIVFKLGYEIDEPMLQQIKTGYDAIHVATGAQNPRDIQLPGSHLPEVWQAIDFLALTNLKKAPDLVAKKVLILGGGDTAMDSVRCAIRLGAAATQVAYRQSQPQMRAALKEQQAALDEGAEFLFNHQPIAILGDQHVTGVYFKTPSSDQKIQTDRVILAFGFYPEPPAWLSGLGVHTNHQGQIDINHNGQTNHQHIYAGGDNTHGPDMVVTAIAAGLRAADGIIQRLKAQPIKASPVKQSVMISAQENSSLAY